MDLFNLKMKKYLITGITGFIAPYFILPLINKGHKVVGLVRDENKIFSIEDIISPEELKVLISSGKLEFIEGDITDKNSMTKLFSENKFDGVFNLAGICTQSKISKEPYNAFLINALGTVNIVDAIEKHQPSCKLMHMSTSAVYGNQENLIDEDTPISPTTPYGTTKAAADIYVKERALTKNLPFFITRVFNVTGPTHQKEISLGYFANTIIKIEKGIIPPIIRVGKLDAQRTWLDVRDIAEICINLMDIPNNPGEIYNIGGDNIYSMEELLGKMLEIRNLKDKIKIDPDPNLIQINGIQKIISNSSKVKKSIDWQPKISIEDSLKDLLNYYSQKYSL